jgi:hypothetical protein
MAQVFLHIRETRNQIDANVFSINYSKQSIEVKNEELKMHQAKMTELTSAGVRLGKKIEEAEISHMRTDQIFEKIKEYAAHMEDKLESVKSRSQSVLGDCILLATSVVYLGVFAPEEREQIRSQLFEYLTKVRNIKCNSVWTSYETTQTANPTKSMFILVLKDLGLRDIINKHNLPDVLSNH